MDEVRVDLDGNGLAAVHSRYMRSRRTPFHDGICHLWVQVILHLVLKGGTWWAGSTLRKYRCIAVVPEP